MERRFREERLDRRYVLVPVVLCMLLVVLGLGVTEMRRQQTREINNLARERQDVLRVLAETIYSALESESAQRGYLLTGNRTFRVPFESSVEGTIERIDTLAERLASIQPDAVPVIESVRRSYATKLEEMHESMALLEAGRNVAALHLVQSGEGLRQMRSIREQLESLRMQQRDALLQDIAEVNRLSRMNTIINAAMSGFTLVVLLVAGLLASRDLRRRRVYSQDLRRRVADSTYQIRDLTRHMARISEVERHALARELHDELGGVLVSLKMDISQIRRRLPPSDNPDLETRWKRVDQALGAGIELKRRVIEELRPTLLDTMGLFTALRWQAGQTCNAAGITAHIDIPEEDQPFAPDVAIAVFRTVQEALANVARHAGANNAWVTAAFANGLLDILVEDDGVGVPDDAETRAESHGVKQMRFRIESLDGTFSVARREPRGTRLRIVVPEAPAAR